MDLIRLATADSEANETSRAVVHVPVNKMAGVAGTGRIHEKRFNADSFLSVWNLSIRNSSPPIAKDFNL